MKFDKGDGNMKNLFSDSKILIGMIHLPPSLGFEGHPGIDYCVQKSLADLKNLEEAGFDAVLIENDDDKPSTELANSSQVANFAIVAHEVAKNAKIPVGVQVMLNDWKSSIEIATLIKAKFIRIDVFVDHVTSRWGEIKPDPQEIMAYKKALYPELLVMTDIQVKHKTMLENKTLVESARQAIENGSDALVVTGNATGEDTPTGMIQEVKTAFPDFPVIVGAGVNSSTIGEKFKYADGAIVGTSIKIGDKVDIDKARLLVLRIRI